VLTEPDPSPGWTVRLDGTVEWGTLLSIVSLCQRFGIEPTRLDLRQRRLTVYVNDRRPAEMLARYLSGRGMTNRLAPAEGAAREMLRRLSPRERELLEHLAQGRQLKQAAFQMGITVNSGREYWSRIRSKWRVRTQAEGAAMLTSLVHQSAEGPAL
jgi:DNA-binding CsgD family transcriptional regulator